MKGWVGGVLKASDLNDKDASANIINFFENGYQQLKDIL